MHFNNLAAKCSQAIDFSLFQAITSLQSSTANCTCSKTFAPSGLEKDSTVHITDILQLKLATTSSFISPIFIRAKALIKKITSSNFTFKTIPKKSTPKKSGLNSFSSFFFTLGNSLKKIKAPIKKAKIKTKEERDEKSKDVKNKQNREYPLVCLFIQKNLEFFGNLKLQRFLFL